MTYTEHLPTYAATWVDPDDAQGLIASYLRPLSTEAAQHRTCESCGLAESPRDQDPLYDVVAEGIAQHLACFLGLCTAQRQGGTLLLTLVPVVPPPDYDD